MADRSRRSAGVLLTRTTESGALELAVLHRSRHDDWTWPRSELEPDEHPAQAALREVGAATGLAVTLRHRLGRTSYTRPGVTTRVHWYGATAGAGGPPDAAVARGAGDTLSWVSASEAEHLLSYASDRIPLSALLILPPVEASVMLVRHASAGDRKLWSGPDAGRPLDRPGQEQARRLAPVLTAFAPGHLVSATPLRCQETLRPLAGLSGSSIEIDAAYDDSSWQRGPRRVMRALARTTRRAGTTAICSQGELIPGLIAELARGDATRTARAAVSRASRGSGHGRTPRSRKGSFWVLSFSGGQLVAADYVAH